MIVREKLSLGFLLESMFGTADFQFGTFPVMEIYWLFISLENSGNPLGSAVSWF
jgi:hypothetical protein